MTIFCSLQPIMIFGYNYYPDIFSWLQNIKQKRINNQGMLVNKLLSTVHLFLEVVGKYSFFFQQLIIYNPNPKLWAWPHCVGMPRQYARLSDDSRCFFALRNCARGSHFLNIAHSFADHKATNSYNSNVTCRGAR